jgi:hypothetical protein
VSKTIDSELGMTAGGVAGGAAALKTDFSLETEVWGRESSTAKKAVW